MENIIYGIFKQIGDLSADVYFIYDTNKGHLSYISPAIELLLGIPAENILNEPEMLLKNVHQEDVHHVKQHLRQRLASNAQNTTEFRIHRPAGKENYISATTYLITGADNKKLIAGIARDITVERNNTIYAEKINGRKDTMLTVLAHDLKGPIGIINLMASSILNDAETSGNEQILSAIKIIKELCQRNINLIKDLLDSEFLESPEVKLRKERIDIIWAINDIMDHYKKAEAVMSKTFIFTRPVEKLFIYIDTLKIGQALNNLISNAIKFTPENGTIELIVADHPSSIIISVKDDGIGIPTEMQPFLFDKFTRARRPGLLGEETTGLGMSVIKALVELHHGRIWFESQENKGSSFYIELPK